MSDVSGRSEADVALALLDLIAESEKKILRSSGSKFANTDRKWILDTYAECLKTIRNSGARTPERPNSGSGHCEGLVG